MYKWGGEEAVRFKSRKYTKRLGQDRDSGQKGKRGLGLKDKLGGEREESKVKPDFSGFIDWRMDGGNSQVGILHMYREHFRAEGNNELTFVLLRFGGQLKQKEVKDSCGWSTLENTVRAFLLSYA